MTTYTAAQSLGRNVRLIRGFHGLTQSDVVRAVANYGLRWSTARVTLLEAGKGSATVETLVALSLALSEATDRPVTVADLLRADGGNRLELGKGFEVDEKAFVQVLSGAKTHLEPDEVAGSLEARDRVLSPDADLMADVGEGIQPEQVRAALKARDVADQRAARKLGVSDGAFIGACLRRWGRMMSEEAAARVGPGSAPQARGQVTRKLVDELRRDFRQTSPVRQKV